jgi:purine-cytosine permease-like protein
MAGSGAVLVIVILLYVVWFGVSYWVSQDAKRRGSRHHFAWGVGVFLIGLIGLILYLVVRGDMNRGRGAY